MKKMKVGLVVAAILIGGINMNKSNQLNAMSEVVLANVEALAGSKMVLMIIQMAIR